MSDSANNESGAKADDNDEEGANHEEEEDKEIVDEEEEDEASLPLDHPLFRRLQDDLKRQLDTLCDTVDSELRDKAALKTKLSSDREEIGVQLYSVQQQLAKLQVRLTETNEARAAYEKDRHTLEEDLKASRESLHSNEDAVKKRQSDYENQRDELDKLNSVVIQLEKYNQDTLNEVAVTRRETYKSEQSAGGTESRKKSQDLYIDRLTHQIQDIKTNLSTIEAQILAQRSETKTARDALLQSSLEMEKIDFERNQLMKEWKSSLIGIEVRTKVLNSLEADSKKQIESIQSLQNEFSGLKQQIADQEDARERNSSILSKTENRIQFINGKIASAKAEREGLQKTLDGLYSLIGEKERQISRLIIDRNNAKSEFNLSQKGTNEVSNHIHEIEDEIIKHVTEQSDLKRDAVSSQEAVEKVRAQIEEKDRELSELQNEVMRLRMDRLGIIEQCQRFETGLKEIVDELQAKDNLITQYEMQIRHNNTNIEKRQSEVDKLNRKYDDLKSAQNGEEYGPLERKIRQIQSRIQQSEETAAENQSVWLKKQTELVAFERSCEDLQNTNITQQAHIAVLSRKRDRTRSQLQSTEKEIEKLQIQIRTHQREMSSLGEQLSVSVGNGSALVEGNVNFEAEILERLRTKEVEAASLETQIDGVSSEREDLAEDLMETEKSIMLLEKKLQLTREMKDALDPNYGASELGGMKKEVARMELRLKQLKKQQQMIVQEMEFALRRRETIANRGAVQQRLNKDKTRADVAKGITELKREVRRLNEEAARFTDQMQKDVESQRELGAEIEQLAHISREIQLKKSELENSLRQNDENRKVDQLRLEKLQQKCRLFQGQGQKTLLKSQDGFESAFSNAKRQESQISSLLDTLTTEFPHLSDQLKSVRDRLVSV